MASVLVTGTSRGLGLQIVKRLLSAPPATIGTIFATARAPQIPDALSEIIDSSNGRIKYVSLDVGSDTSVAQAVKIVTSHLDGGRGLDMLINNAAITMITPKPTEATAEDLTSIFSTNVGSVQRVTAAFLPLLKQGKEKKIMDITSTLGSIALAPNFAAVPSCAYNVSKAALNMLVKQHSMELGPDGFTVFCISPGHLKTDLGGPYAALEASYGADQVVTILLEATPEKDNGAFRDIYVEGDPTYTGADPPW